MLKIQLYCYRKKYIVKCIKIEKLFEIVIPFHNITVLLYMNK